MVLSYARGKINDLATSSTTCIARTRALHMIVFALKNINNKTHTDTHTHPPTHPYTKYAAKKHKGHKLRHKNNKEG